MQYVKYLAIPLVLLLAHTLLVVWVWIESVTTYSNNPGGDFIWLTFELVDWVVWTVIESIVNGDAQGKAAILILGGLQWFTIGLGLKLFVTILGQILPRHESRSGFLA